MLPYLAPDPKTGIAPFDCRSCQDPDAPVGYMPIEVRRSWHCGWLDRDEWTAFGLDGNLFDRQFTLEDGQPCDICPGYLASLPQVREAADCAWSIKERCIERFYPEAPILLEEAARAALISYGVYEAKRTAELSAQNNP